MQMIRYLKKMINLGILKFLRYFVYQIVYEETFVWGNKKRLHIDPSAKMVNTLFNTMSGEIYIGEYVFTGHNVSIITGSHDYNKFAKERMFSWQEDGNDIFIEKGVWIGSNSVIIGPCKIGENSVIAAGSVVIEDVQSNTIVGGIPAHFIKSI